MTTKNVASCSRSEESDDRMTSVIQIMTLCIILCSFFIHTVDCFIDTSPCQSYTLNNDNEVRIDCRQKQLSKLPKHIFHSNIFELDLSMNYFSEIKGKVFKELAKLQRLNISQSGIRFLSAETFEGLIHLEELDIKNNPVIATGLPPGIFNCLPSLRRLQLSGEITTDAQLRSYGTLHSLEEIAITPDMDNTPYSLTTLDNLTAIYFAFSRKETHLTRELLHPFSFSNITELSFVNCELISIDLDAFDGFSSLKTLNVIGNKDLEFDTVIDALSSSKDVNVSTLIADMISFKHTQLGNRDYPKCRRAFRHLQQLSIRGNAINDISVSFLRCLSNIERIALGFNPFALLSSNYRILQTLAKGRFIYIDFSYFGYVSYPTLPNFIGYYKSDNFIKRNEDYFRTPEEVSLNKSSMSDQDKVQPATPDNCPGFGLPLNLTYIIANHIAIQLTSNLQECYKYFPNNLKYIDLSYPFTNEGINITFTPVMYGLTKLEVVKLAGLRLYYVNMAIFQNLPFLRILDLKSNRLGLGSVKPFPSLPHLEELDLSNNLVKEFPNDMFVKLTSLHRLVISRNMLTSLDFHLPDKLNYLDISGNRFTSLDDSTRMSIDHLPQVVLHMDNNPFQCECIDTEWIEWYQRTETQIVNKNLVTCYHHTGPHVIVDADIASLKLTCGITVNRAAMSAVSIGLVIFFLTGGHFMYKYRWTIRWRYYQLHYQRKKRRNDEMLLTESNIQHSAYVIYANEDVLSREWVVRTLVPGVEVELQKPRMFIKDRDELLVKYIFPQLYIGILFFNTDVGGLFWILPKIRQLTRAAIAVLSHSFRFQLFLLLN